MTSCLRITAERDQGKCQFPIKFLLIFSPFLSSNSWIPNSMNKVSETIVYMIVNSLFYIIFENVAFNNFKCFFFIPCCFPE